MKRLMVAVVLVLAALAVATAPAMAEEAVEAPPRGIESPCPWSWEGS